jgi:hypothetical protein
MTSPVTGEATPNNALGETRVVVGAHVLAKGCGDRAIIRPAGQRKANIGSADVGDEADRTVGGEAMGRRQEWARAAASRARASIATTSGRPMGASQLPPTQSTLGIASQSGALSAVIPPVGQKRAW